MKNLNLALLPVGSTFKCGPNGSITGTIVANSQAEIDAWNGDNDIRTHENSDPECFGYIYTLNKPVRVWKGARKRRAGAYYNSCDVVLVPLEIPANTKIRAGYRPIAGTYYANSASTGKCRAAKAIVLSFPGSGEWTAHSEHDPDFEYKRGQIVKPDFDFDDDPNDQCSSGIHFFFTIKETQAYFGTRLFKNRSDFPGFK